MWPATTTIAIPLFLLQAYVDTTYLVFLADNPFSLRIGQRSEDLVALHSAHGASASVFITACNPLGVLLSDDANITAMSRLGAYLDERSIPWLPGAGEIVGGSWPPEPSLLAVGVSRTDARGMCLTFEQNAVVWNSSDGVPALLLHPDAVISHVDAGPVERASEQDLMVDAAARVAETCGPVGTAGGVEAFVHNSAGLCHRSIEQRIRAAVWAALGSGQ